MNVNLLKVYSSQLKYCGDVSRGVV